MSRKIIQTEDQSTNNKISGAERFRCFLHNRLWLGLPVAVVTAFFLLFLIRGFIEQIPFTDALLKSAHYAVVIGVCWAIGVWASTADNIPGEDNAPEGRMARWPRWARLSVFGMLVLGAFLLICTSQITDILYGDSTPAQGAVGMLLKALAIASVLIPLMISSRRR